MTSKIPLPFTGLEFDPTDGRSIVMTMLLGVFGFASLYMVQDLGASVKGTVSETVGLGSEGADAPEVL